jgi:glycosyltransferase involved in cell wall biosynthesis
VDTDFYRPDPGQAAPGTGALVVSALVPYKRIDIAIEAARLTQTPLRIVGQGPEEARLRALAGGAPVEFLGWRSDDEVRELYRASAAVLLPGIEDFGIVPVEAQACGTPVVAFGHGGACETVVDGVTGALVADRSGQAFAEALDRVRRRPCDREVIRRHAERFSKAAFTTRFAAAIVETSREHTRTAPPRSDHDDATV